MPLIDFNYYFYRVYTHPLFRWFQGERLVEMARTLRGFGPGWTGYLLTDTYDSTHETLRFLSRAWGLQMHDVASLADVLPLRALPERGALFIMSQAGARRSAGDRPDVLRAPSSCCAASRRCAPGGSTRGCRSRPPAQRWSAPASIRSAAVDAEHPRIDPPHGLLAEYDLRGVHLARAEPYPFYAFFPPTFPRARPTCPSPSADQRCDGVMAGTADRSPTGRLPALRREQCRRDDFARRPRPSAGTTPVCR